MRQPTPGGADRVIALIADHAVGLDAMRWTPAPAPQAQPAPATVPADVRVGDVVDYHGSITAHHGEFVVITVDTGTGRLTLRDHHYPDTRLTRVRPISISATGRWVAVCRCQHPLTHPIQGPTGHCPLPGCHCPHHP